jgi:uncharacterized protein with HEPN domain
MKTKNHKLYLEDILEAVEKIQRYTKGLTYDAFVKNEMAVDAVIRNLEIIGEAAKNLPQDIKDKYPDVPWKRMIGLRNIAVHEYFGVDLSIIWEVVTKNLPETKAKIVEALKNLDKG